MHRLCAESSAASNQIYPGSHIPLVCLTFGQVGSCITFNRDERGLVRAGLARAAYRLLVTHHMFAWKPPLPKCHYPNRFHQLTDALASAAVNVGHGCLPVSLIAGLNQRAQAAALSSHAGSACP